MADPDDVARELARERLAMDNFVHALDTGLTIEAPKAIHLLLAQARGFVIRVRNRLDNDEALAAAAQASIREDSEEVKSLRVALLESQLRIKALEQQLAEVGKERNPDILKQLAEKEDALLEALARAARLEAASRQSVLPESVVAIEALRRRRGRDPESSSDDEDAGPDYTDFRERAFPGSEARRPRPHPHHGVGSSFPLLEEALEEANDRPETLDALRALGDLMLSTRLKARTADGADQGRVEIECLMRAYKDGTLSNLRALDEAVEKNGTGKFARLVQVLVDQGIFAVVVRREGVGFFVGLHEWAEENQRRAEEEAQAEAMRRAEEAREKREEERRRAEEAANRAAREEAERNAKQEEAEKAREAEAEVARRMREMAAKEMEAAAERKKREREEQEALEKAAREREEKEARDKASQEKQAQEAREKETRDRENLKALQEVAAHAREAERARAEKEEAARKKREEEAAKEKAEAEKRKKREEEAAKEKAEAARKKREEEALDNATKEREAREKEAAKEKAEAEKKKKHEEEAAKEKAEAEKEKHEEEDGEAEEEKVMLRKLALRGQYLTDEQLDDYSDVDFGVEPDARGEPSEEDIDTVKAAYEEWVAFQEKLEQDLAEYNAQYAEAKGKADAAREALKEANVVLEKARPLQTVLGWLGGTLPKVVESEFLDDYDAEIEAQSENLDSLETLLQHVEDVVQRFQPFVGEEAWENIDEGFGGLEYRIHNWELKRETLVGKYLRPTAVAIDKLGKSIDKEQDKTKVLVAKWNKEWLKAQAPKEPEKVDDYLPMTHAYSKDELKKQLSKRLESYQFLKGAADIELETAKKLSADEQARTDRLNERVESLSAAHPDRVGDWKRELDERAVLHRRLKAYIANVEKLVALLTPKSNRSVYLALPANYADGDNGEGWRWLNDATNRIYADISRGLTKDESFERALKETDALAGGGDGGAPPPQSQPNTPQPQAPQVPPSQDGVRREPAGGTNEPIVLVEPEEAVPFPSAGPAEARWFEPYKRPDFTGLAKPGLAPARGTPIARQDPFVLDRVAALKNVRPSLNSIPGQKLIATLPLHGLGPRFKIGVLAEGPRKALQVHAMQHLYGFNADDKRGYGELHLAGAKVAGGLPQGELLEYLGDDAFVYGLYEFLYWRDSALQDENRDAVKEATAPLVQERDVMEAARVGLSKEIQEFAGASGSNPTAVAAKRLEGMRKEHEELRDRIVAIEAKIQEEAAKVKSKYAEPLKRLDFIVRALGTIKKTKQNEDRVKLLRSLSGNAVKPDDPFSPAKGDDEYAKLLEETPVPICHSKTLVFLVWWRYVGSTRGGNTPGEGASNRPAQRTDSEWVDALFDLLDVAASGHLDTHVVTKGGGPRAVAALMCRLITSLWFEQFSYGLDAIEKRKPENAVDLVPFEPYRADPSRFKLTEIGRLFAPRMAVLSDPKGGAVGAADAEKNNDLRLDPEYVMFGPDKRFSAEPKPVETASRAAGAYFFNVFYTTPLLMGLERWMRKKEEAVQKTSDEAARNALRSLFGEIAQWTAYVACCMLDGVEGAKKKPAHAAPRFRAAVPDDRDASGYRKQEMNLAEFLATFETMSLCGGGEYTMESLLGTHPMSVLMSQLNQDGALDRYGAQLDKPRRERLEKILQALYDTEVLLDMRNLKARAWRSARKDTYLADAARTNEFDYTDITGNKDVGPVVAFRSAQIPYVAYVFEGGIDETGDDLRDGIMTPSMNVRSAWGPELRKLTDSARRGVLLRLLPMIQVHLRSKLGVQWAPRKDKSKSKPDPYLDAHIAISECQKAFAYVQGTRIADGKTGEAGDYPAAFGGASLVGRVSARFVKVLGWIYRLADAHARGIVESPYPSETSVLHDLTLEKLTAQNFYGPKGTFQAAVLAIFGDAKKLYDLVEGLEDIRMTIDGTQFSRRPWQPTLLHSFFGVRKGASESVGKSLAPIIGWLYSTYDANPATNPPVPTGTLAPSPTLVRVEAPDLPETLSAFLRLTSQDKRWGRVLDLNAAWGSWDAARRRRFVDMGEERFARGLTDLKKDPAFPRDDAAMREAYNTFFNLVHNHYRALSSGARS